MDLKIYHTATQDRKTGKGREDVYFQPKTEFSPSHNTYTSRELKQG